MLHPLLLLYYKRSNLIGYCYANAMTQSISHACATNNLWVLQ